MRPMGKHGDTKSRKVTPPAASYMSNDQFANYLSELRSNRMARPGGARPQPAGARPPPPARSSMSRPSLDASSQAESHVSGAISPNFPSPSNAPSVSSRYSLSSMRGRDYYPTKPAAQPPKPDDVVPTGVYMERGQRWMEKEEAFSLRDAMEEMDLREASQTSSKDSPKKSHKESQPLDDEEARIHDAALNEAAELVWQHQNPGQVRPPDGPYRYRPHLRKNSYAHARAASAGRYGEDIATSGLARDSSSRSVSGSSSEGGEGLKRGRTSIDSIGSKSRTYGSVGSRAEPASNSGRRSSMRRNISGEVNRPFSGVQIWEEPESASTTGATESGRASPDKLSNKPQNPLNRVRFQGSTEEPDSVKPHHDRVEIHRNPPTRSRDAQYQRNSTLSSTPSPVNDKVERKNGVEIRSQDIREATSMRLKDRSPRLPEPTAVSDSPGRPIVSFNANWRAPDEPTDSSPEKGPATSSPSRRQFHSRPQPQPVGIPSVSVEADPAPRPRSSTCADIPSINVAAPEAPSTRPLPTINVPTIAVDESSGDVGSRDNNDSSNNIPSICLPGEEPAKNSQSGSQAGSQATSQRPLPTQRPQRAQLPPQGHWSRASGAAGKGLAMCHECGYPIDGRFVKLAGGPERFHPQCLRCCTCGTSLEAMEISPEPTQVRGERLDRIRRREAGEILDETPGMTMAEDGDDRLRFYCHLDWHELFAPRCKHCKTPILGEHIVALGQHFHYGHFFCAECGDPFEQGMTHIEKDGYAWCINCQTKRTERRAPKCKMCRTAVVGEYIRALGGEWHEHCFRCAECHGSFDDGQIFPKELPGGKMVIMCTSCRTRELKR